MHFSYGRHLNESIYFFNRDAYRIACLGVTDGDWRALAMAALEVGLLNHIWLLFIFYVLFFSVSLHSFHFLRINFLGIRIPNCETGK